MATVIPANTARFTAAEVSFVVGGSLGADLPAGQLLDGVCTDSRAVTAGSLFVAVRGEAFDGHAFAARAVAAGAAAALVDAPIVGVPCIVVDDTLAALGALARHHRRRWGGIVIGITGSAGKTTTKELTATALRARLGDAVHATRGNLNNRVGLPMTLLGLSPRHRAAVLELGTSVRGEIAALTAVCEPEVGVLVHVGVAHAEGLSSAPRRAGEPSWVGRVGPAEAVAKEKGALLEGARRLGLACADEPLGRAALSLARVGKTFGRDPSADVRLEGERFDADGRAHATIGGRPFSLSLLGEVALLDATAAVAGADAVFGLLGLGAVPAGALAEARATPGRLSLRRRTDGAWVVDDTYNASPSAFLSSLRTVRRLADATGRRLIVVAGEMRELGAVAEAAHDEVARAIAATRPERLVTLGGLADRFGGERFADAAAATNLSVGPTDLVLVKASRGVGAEVVVDAILAQGGEIPDAGAQGGR